ncbi:hypothetical protein C804_05611 [Lachnospiraceae bacterium A4]|nr:hypothetical protein C804_05611 [Lachnospiraceae bacterium A4]
MLLKLPLGGMGDLYDLFNTFFISRQGRLSENP